MKDFLLNFLKGAAGAALLALQNYLAGADLTELGMWAALGGAIVGLAAWGMGKLREKMGL